VAILGVDVAAPSPMRCCSTAPSCGRRRCRRRGGRRSRADEALAQGIELARRGDAKFDLSYGLLTHAEVKGVWVRCRISGLAWKTVIREAVVVDRTSASDWLLSPARSGIRVRA
jgi:hypothetical protein